MAFSLRTVACLMATAVLLARQTNATAIPEGQEDVQSNQNYQPANLGEPIPRTHVVLASQSVNAKLKKKLTNLVQQWENTTITWYGLNNNADDNSDSDNTNTATTPEPSLVARGSRKGGDHLTAPTPNECKVTEGPHSDECVATATCYTYESAQAAARPVCLKLRDMINSESRPPQMHPGSRSFCITDKYLADSEDAQCCITWSNQPREEPLEASWDDLDLYSEALINLCGTYKRMSGVVHGGWLGEQCVNACVGKHPHCFKG